MDFFNSLWEDPEQTQVPSSENFGSEITSEKWVNHSSTYKLITGNFRHPHEWLNIEDYFPNSSKKQSRTSQNVPARIKKNEAVHTSVKYYKEENVDEMPQGASNDSKDPKDDEHLAESSFCESNRYVPGLRKNPVINKLSCMDNREHAQCLSLFLKFRSNVVMPCDRSENFKFEVMYRQVQEEQKEFCQDALKQWSERAKDVQNLSGDYMRILQTMWMVKAKNTLEYYPHSFKKRSMVPLFPGDLKIDMIKISDLLQMGKIPIFFPPALINRTTPSIKISKILQSTQHNLKPAEVIGSLHKLPVSLDPNAESLARLHKAQIVISSGALNTLVETYFSPLKNWILPITVKEYRTIDKGKTTTKTMVFIDKPLANQSMTAEEGHRFLAKHGVKSRLLASKHQLCFSFPVPGVDLLEVEKSPEVPSKEDDIKDSTQKLEQTASKTDQTEKVSIENAKVSLGDDVDNDSEDEKLVIEEDPSETRNLEIHEEKSSVLAPPSHDISAKSAQPVEYKKQEPFARKDGLRLPKTSDGFTAPISNTNVTYSSWVIRPENIDQLSVHQKKALRELSVIVRCRVDGCQRANGDFAALSLSTKLEYQVEFTAAEPTKEELAREWASLFFKPASLVIRTRVDVKDSEIIMCEKKDKAQITADAQRIHGLRLSDSLQTLYSVFSEVASLPKGSYLLHHSSVDNAFATLEESIGTPEAQRQCHPVRNLEEYFGRKLSVTVDPNLAWRKLDCTLVLPRHELLHIMPATYRPKPCGKSFKARNIPSRVKTEGPKRPGFTAKKNKGKKKKKKKNKNNPKNQQQNNNE